MQTRKMPVTSRVTGTTLMAELLLCECGHDQFYMYAIGPHNHLQCTKCQACFCDGKCESMVLS